MSTAKFSAGGGGGEGGGGEGEGGGVNLYNQGSRESLKVLKSP